MLKIRAGWGAVVCAGICLLMATSVLAADDFGYENFMLNWFMTHSRKAEINDSFNHAIRCGERQHGGGQS